MSRAHFDGIVRRQATTCQVEPIWEHDITCPKSLPAIWTAASPVDKSDFHLMGIGGQLLPEIRA